MLTGVFTSCLGTGAEAWSRGACGCGCAKGFCCHADDAAVGNRGADLRLDTAPTGVKGPDATWAARLYRARRPLLVLLKDLF
jgi:hypothetical protein